MSNKTFLLKSVVVASFSLMAIITPCTLPPTWGQGKPAATEAAKAEVERLIEQGRKQYQQGQMEAAIATLQQALLLARRYSLREYEALPLLASGRVYHAIGQPEKALTYYTQALPIFREMKDRSGEATTLNNIGTVYGDIGQPEKALEYYTQALPIFREVKDRSGEAATLDNIRAIYSAIGQPEKSLQAAQAEVVKLIKQGITQYQQGQTEAAIAIYQEALLLARRYSFKEYEAILLAASGRVYNDISQPEKALEYFTQALLILREVKDRIGEAVTLNNMGEVYLGIGQLEKALEYFTQALPILREEKFRAGEATTFSNIGTVYSDLGQLERALEYYTQALTIFREVKNRAGEATTLNNMGTVYRDISQPEKALEYYTQALPILREVKDRSGEATTLNNIGVVYLGIGQPDKALKYYTQALPILREVKYRSMEATTLNNMGEVYRNIGQLEKALEYYTQALPILREVKNRSVEATTLNNMGAVYRDIGQLEKALEYYTQALSISREVRSRSIEATTLNNMGVVHRDIGQLVKALEYYTQALPIRREVKDRVGEAATLNNMGEAYYGIGQPEKTLEYYTQALAISREVKNRFGEATTLNNMGEVYYGISQPEKALEYYTQALTISREVKDRLGEAKTVFNLSYISQQQGKLDIALQQVEAAISILETTRSEIRSNELRTTFLASVQDYYKFKVDLLMQLHRRNPSQQYNHKALEASERGRARSLTDLLNESRIDIREGVDPALLAREKSLTFQLRALETRRVQLASTNPTAPQLQQLDQDYNTLQSQYQQIQSQIRATSPRYAALTQPQPITLKDIQALLDDDTVLLEYSMGRDRSYLWLVSKNGLSSYELPKAKELGNLARQYFSLITDKNVLNHTKKAEFEQVGQQLHQQLLGPVANQLEQKRLVIVSDGPLFHIPFAALPLANSQQPLITQHEIIHLPSAAALAQLRSDPKRRPTKTIALLADPVFNKDDPRLKTPPPQAIAQLPPAVRFVTRSDSFLERLTYTEVEAQNILKLVPAAQQQSWLGFAANLDNATHPGLADYQIIHFATHGIFNTQHPERSGLVFSRLTASGSYRNSDLTLQEIFNLKLQADLVVLSACKTGLGQTIDTVQDTQGEGLVGLTRGFMYAGAPRVLVSLWSVNDESTAMLMSQFYQNKLAQGMTPAAALRQAQLDLLRQPKYQAPFHWAPFILQGEWR
jgi:CHAT domain-containing protein/Tfp pilus assembly protein PilF